MACVIALVPATFRLAAIVRSAIATEVKRR